MTAKAPGWFEKGAAKRISLAALFAIGAIWPISVFLYFDPVSLRDFNNLWVSGHAVRLGVDPYDLKAFKALGDQILGVANYNFTSTSHPLPARPAVIPAATGCAARVERGFGTPILVGSAALDSQGDANPPGDPDPRRIDQFSYGQTGVICAALFLMAFRGSGLAAAILTIKPQLGFLVLPAMLRDRRAFTIAAIATITLIAGSAVVFGGWFEFFAHARDFQGKNLADLSQIIWMVKGTTPAIGYGLWSWAAFAAGAAFLLSRNYNVFTAATATFLISPYGLHYDMAALCLGFAVLPILDGTTCRWTTRLRLQWPS